MKIIRITTECEVSAVEFPAGSISKQNEVLRKLIGPQCELYEHVMPDRLYSVMGGPDTPGDCVSMLVDEEGLYHDLDINFIGSWLYKTDIHGFPIVGNILIVGERWDRDGIVFCGIPDQQFSRLHPQFEHMAEKPGSVPKKGEIGQ